MQVQPVPSITIEGELPNWLRICAKRNVTMNARTVMPTKFEGNTNARTEAAIGGLRAELSCLYLDLPSLICLDSEVSFRGSLVPVERGRHTHRPCGESASPAIGIRDAPGLVARRPAIRNLHVKRVELDPGK